MKQHFFLFGRYLGARPIPTYTSIGAEHRIASSYLLICPQCAEIWGRLMHDAPGSYTQLVSSNCIKHAIFASDATFSTPNEIEGYPRTIQADWPLAALNHDVEALATFALTQTTKEKPCHPQFSLSHLSSADQRFLSLAHQVQEKPVHLEPS